MLVRRRLLAAVLAMVAVLAGFRAVAAPPEETIGVVVARGDLPGGASVRADQLSTAELPTDAVPAGAAHAVDEVTGRVLAAPLRRGEPVTDVRLLAPGLLDGYPGLVAAPVRVADAGAVRLLEVGDRIDLIAASPEGGGATVVASGAPVVAVPGTSRSEAGMVSGGLVVVAVTSATALAIAEASVTAVLSVVLTR